MYNTLDCFFLYYVHSVSYVSDERVHFSSSHLNLVICFSRNYQFLEKYLKISCDYLMAGALYPAYHISDDATGCHVIPAYILKLIPRHGNSYVSTVDVKSLYVVFLCSFVILQLLIQIRIKFGTGMVRTPRKLKHAEQRTLYL